MNLVAFLQLAFELQGASIQSNEVFFFFFFFQFSSLRNDLRKDSV